jgi:hypothetical protein
MQVAEVPQLEQLLLRQVVQVAEVLVEIQQELLVQQTVVVVVVVVEIIVEPVLEHLALLVAQE